MNSGWKFDSRWGLRARAEAGAGVGRAFGGSVLAVAVLTGIGGVWVRDAVAQDVAQDVTQPPVDLAPAVSGQVEADVSPEALRARGKQFVLAIEQASQSMLRQLQSSRQDHDVVRALCLSDKLNQVDVALRSAQDRLAVLEVAGTRGDADGVRHEYTVIEVLNERVRVLVQESNQCVGEETGFIGDADVSVSIDPNLPDAMTDFGTDLEWIPAPPNISSPIE